MFHLGKNAARTIAFLLSVATVLCLFYPAQSFRAEDISVAGEASLPSETEIRATAEGMQKLADESGILQYIDQAEFFAAKHVERIKDQEELNTYVFLNEDGTRSLYYMAENVRYRTEDGRILEKDLSLVPAKAYADSTLIVKEEGADRIVGNLSVQSTDARAASGYSTSANDITVFLPQSLSNGVAVQYEGHTVRLLPQTAETRAITLAVPDSSTNSILYPAVFQKNITVRYTPMLSGVKEDIILSSYTGISSFTFLLETDGSFLCEKDGHFYLSDKENGEEYLLLRDIVVYDAAHRQTLGRMEAETVKEGSLYTVTVIADEDFLKDPETVYPVTVDPQITLNENAAGTAIYDAPIFKNKPDTNFGAFLFNSIGQGDTDYGVARTVMSFAGLSSNPVYNSLGANDIKSAVLYVKEATGTPSQGVYLTTFLTPPSWTESTVTWRNTGTYALNDSVGCALTNGQWSAINIELLARGWKSSNYGRADGLVFWMSGGETDHFKQIDSTECSTASYRPYLKLDYQYWEPFASGSYFIENKQLGSSLRPKNRLSTASNPMELWDYLGETDQLWNLTSLGNGYYKITSAKSGLALAVQSGSVSAENGKIVQESYTGATRQQWRFYYTVYNGYAIKPRSAEGTNFVLSVSEGVLGNGAVVSQRAYIYNKSFKDEWKILPCRYGMKPFRVLDTDSRGDINCFTYAMWLGGNNNSWTDEFAQCSYQLEEDLTSGKLALTVGVKKMLSAAAKADFEKWLSDNHYTAELETDFTGNGTRILQPNQYRVVLRTGIKYIECLPGLFRYVGDYHFWYQTYDGTWADKHGKTTEEHLPKGDMPSTTYSAGWCVNGSLFYDGPYYVYIITTK